jgi:lysozyme
MRINQAGLELIKRFEGFRSAIYYDLGGKATIGYGHLVKSGEKFTTITIYQAEQLMQKDLLTAENVVAKLVKVQLSENQFSAIVAFIFNLGEMAFTSSTLLKYINQGRYLDVPEQILRWHRVGMQPYKGLIARRAAEAMLFIS